ncbi:hypothetical protein RRG08_066993 [Elysia crispata]|uniref:Uncharacterized protein n=1 Tax=Elysia crispata TaxID=231223 RepID=A0AAE0ZBL6_9GAST|nr:hypothetical protein RRG08_066993 [Elysia crispata]
MICQISSANVGILASDTRCIADRLSYGQEGGKPLITKASQYMDTQLEKVRFSPERLGQLTTSDIGIPTCNLVFLVVIVLVACSLYDAGQPCAVDSSSLESRPPLCGATSSSIYRYRYVSSRYGKEQCLLGYRHGLRWKAGICPNFPLRVLTFQSHRSGQGGFPSPLNSVSSGVVPGEEDTIMHCGAGRKSGAQYKSFR